MGIRIVCDACSSPIGENDDVYCEGCYEKVETYSDKIEELEELVESLQAEINDLENKLREKDEKES